MDILFRAKSEQMWYYGGVYRKKVYDSYDSRIGYPDYIWHWYIVTDDGNEYRIYPDTICQYTGLRDKNDIKIFDGDIVKANRTIPTLDDTIFTVIYAHGCYFIRHANSVSSLYPYNEELEVIGNVYDNPELLELVERTVKMLNPLND